jgi:hypothetical protein
MKALPLISLLVDSSSYTGLYNTQIFFEVNRMFADQKKDS